MEESKEKLDNLRESIKKIKQEINEGSFGAVSQKPHFPEIGEQRLLRGHFGKIYSVHWGGNSAENQLVSASQDGKLIVWNANSTNKVLAIPLKSSWVMSCAFEQEYSTLVASGGLDNICSIHRTNNTDAGIASRPTSELQGHDGYISCCRFINSKQVITSSGDGTCIQWDIDNRKKLKTFSGHEKDVMSLSPSPTDPNVFVSGSVDHKAMLWDIRSDCAQITFEGHESDINTVSYFPDGKAFGSGSDDGSCRLFDIRCFQQLNSFMDGNILCGVTSVAFSYSGALLFGGYDDHKARVWHTVAGPSGQTPPLQSLKNTKSNTRTSHTNRVSCLGSQCHGMALATGSWDTFIKVWA